MSHRNRVRCLTCNETIESVHRHDFRTCPCGAVSVDGGTDYERVLFRGPFVRVNDDGSDGETVRPAPREPHEAPR